MRLQQFLQLIRLQRATLDFDLLGGCLGKKLVHAHAVRVECVTVERLGLVRGVHTERRRQIPEPDAEVAKQIRKVNRPDAGGGYALAQLGEGAVCPLHSERAQRHLRTGEATIPVEGLSDMRYAPRDGSRAECRPHAAG
eukprot:CAMPEP_0181204412 /NCGR_PEP_ID=MMETSP1096-20121128/19923_1 /TAXON_ID=156174 ORGANISM="Chrysochromulina ericina, Strain CCMP281" /NCGR_SAMPLE_ID=MMETSP1096 /ASSEMBLY_ACC=CAM_ASM_000453 /LENGTH=138 /DNA_ID=CAMNT_0023295113 /DNA_START=718 /DNA_END=1134 /DNA_ORIENTATION=-